MKTIKGVILDVDGTLVDSNPAHAKAWQKALAAHGMHFELPQILGLIGMGGDKLLPLLTDIEESSEKGQKIAKLRGEIFRRDYLPRLKALPQARELLQKFRDEGIRWVVATSSNREDFEALAKCVELDLLLDEPQTTKKEAPQSKPSPDVVEAALGELDLVPHEVVMLGDTPYDIQAAQATGVRTIALRSGGWKSSELKGAVAVYNDPADLLAHWSESLFSRETTKIAA
jgi:HAD superfamily hydrolase (TIGR01509 family)